MCALVCAHETYLSMVIGMSVCERREYLGQIRCHRHHYPVQQFRVWSQVQGASSTMTAICLALAMYLRSWTGRKLHSLRKWPVSGWPACLHSGQDLAGWLARVLTLYRNLVPICLRKLLTTVLIILASLEASTWMTVSFSRSLPDRSTV